METTRLWALKGCPGSSHFPVSAVSEAKFCPHTGPFRTIAGVVRESLRNIHSLREPQSRVSLRPGSGMTPERPRPPLRGRAVRG